MKALDLTGEARFLQLASNSPECYWLVDADSQEFTYISSGYEHIWGRTVEALYADPDDWLNYIHPEDKTRFARHLKDHRHGGLEEKFRVVRPDGTERWLHVRSFPVLNEEGRVVSVGGVASDVTRLLGDQRQQAYFAHFDALTALPNQLMFYDQARRLLALAQRKDLPLGVAVVDIDRFREVNQSLGYVGGDELLREVAKRLLASLRESDILGRLGADVFAVLLPDVEEIEQAAIVARRLTETLSLPVMVEGKDIFVTASIGVVFYPQDGKDVHELISHAEIATRHAKASGRNGFQFYTQSMREDVRDRLFLETDLHNAVLRDEFILYYQPKVSCVTGCMTGAEALIRWNHPTRGIVPPDQFIPLLEETGLIVPVGRWALETACRQAMAWRLAGLEISSVSVNLSARQLQSDTLISDVAMALAASGFDPASLDLEITESMLMHDADRAVAILTALKKTGVTLSLDDFGTGYSSLAYLKRFPLDALKVDRSFVQDIAADADDASITRAVITMAHHLKLKVVAEGVETAEQLALLMSHHCDLIQGYFFSRPLPVDKMNLFLAADSRLPANLLGSASRYPTALFVAVDNFQPVISNLQGNGYLIHSVADFDAALLWLAGNVADVLVCGSVKRGFDAVALIKRAAQIQPNSERILLAEDRLWHQKQVAALTGSGILHRVLHLPVAPDALQELLEDTLSKQLISDEHGILSQAVEAAEREVTQLLEERNRLLNENAELHRLEKQGYALMQCVMGEMPWPVIGVDEEGLVALINDAAVLEFSTRNLSMGDALNKALPEVITLADNGQLTIGDVTYACCWRKVGVENTTFGRLLFLQREAT